MGKKVSSYKRENENERRANYDEKVDVGVFAGEGCGTVADKIDAFTDSNGKKI